MQTPKVAVVLVGAGRGVRAGGGLPKQYRPIGGRAPIRMALEQFSAHPAVALVQPVIHADDRGLFAEAAAGLAALPPVSGAQTRQGSVLAGLEALADHAPDIVLVHDAARPFASPALISSAVGAAQATGAAVPGLPVVDSVKLIEGDAGAIRISGTPVDRDTLRTVQTPQAFVFDKLLAAHRRAAAEGLDHFTDDAALAVWAGIPVSIFAGDAANVKLTTEEDFARAERALRSRLTDVRTATGFDVHAFTAGDHVMLGGVRIPHTRALEGHSDADVVLHALTDAILGALADGDIGQHFPPSDPQWRGASSDRFLAFACERVRERGGVVALLDVTVLCETPRIGPHRDAIRARIADIAGIAVSRVAMKATTTERMGFVGRSEGMAALATATVRLPEQGDD